MHARMIDLRGEQFGRLYVLELDDEPSQREHCEWICVCLCGRICCVRSDKLRGLRVRSCGCDPYYRKRHPN
jgi:hypothetical protein